MSEITLHQPLPVWGIANASPFCVKLEFFLRANKIPYKPAAFNPKTAPKGKMPYIKMDEKYYPDSQLIMEMLEKKHEINLDSHLSEEQKQISHLVRRLFENAIYFTVVHSRWTPDENWKTLKKAFFTRLPPIVRTIVPELVRKGLKRTLHGQGVSRYEDHELTDSLNTDLASIDFFMSDKKFFFGDKISSIDFTAYGFLLNFVKAKLPKTLASDFYEHPKFVRYVDRISSEYFSDIK